MNKQMEVKLNDVKNRFLFISPSVQAGAENEPSIADFEIISLLGSGSFGKVYLCKHKVTNAIYAIKEIDKKNKNNDLGAPYFRREIEIMYKINHPNIVKLFGHFEDNLGCYFIMEYIPKGNLYSLLGKQKSKCFDTAKVASFMKDLISSVYYIHNMNPPIVHRDIKPENILISDDGRVKLTDFGWSNYVEYSQIRSTFCGTPLYLAPEVIKKTGHDKSVDIWCIGGLIFELLTGRCPFDGQSDNIIYDNILKNKIDWPKDINLEAKNLIGRILKTDPKDRISLSDMLKHPFFTKNVENPEEFLLKPSEITNQDEKSIYIISRDNPKSIVQPKGKKLDNLISKDFNNLIISNSTISNLNPVPATNLINISNIYSNINNISAGNGNSDNNNKYDYYNSSNINNSNNNYLPTTSTSGNVSNFTGTGTTKTTHDDLIYTTNYIEKDMLAEYKNIQTQLINSTKKISDLHKENEELKLKQKIFALEKEGLIKEKEEQENSKLNLQMEHAQTKYKIFEYEEKLKGLIIVVKSNEQQIDRDRSHINMLYSEIENLKKSKEDVSNFYVNKITQLEQSLREANTKKQNQMQTDLSFFRESIKGISSFWDSSNNHHPQIFSSNASESGNSNPFDFNFLNTLDMLQKDFDEERKKYNLIIETKQDEINRLKIDLSTKNENKILQQKNQIENLNHAVAMKENEINLLNDKLKILENMLNNLNTLKR